MSKWDDLERGAAWLLTPDGDNSRLGDMVSLPSNVEKLSVLLCGEALKESTLSDIYDIGRFAEDFVLYEHVGVPTSMFHYVGPRLVDLRSWDDFPLLDLRGIANALSEEAEKHEKIADTVRPLADSDEFTEQSAAAQRRLLKSMENVSRLLEARLRLQNVGQKDSDILRRTTLPISLSEIFRTLGISVSPGWRYRDEFSFQSVSPQRYFYDGVAGQFDAELRKLQAWETSIDVRMPPILTLLTARAGTAKHLLSELIGLRDEFSEVRRVGQRYRESLAGSRTLRDKLNVINDMDAARDALIRNLSPTPRTSTIQRLWDILKGASLLSAATRFADFLLQWDGNRAVLSSVRCFADIHYVAMDVRYEPARFARLFGSIRDS